MLKSMTGYGRGESKNRVYGEFYVEIQGVNRKYCDININLPKHLSILETNIRQTVLSNITRGRINIFVGQSKANGNQKLEIKSELVKEYYNILKKLKKELNLKGDIDINILSGLKEFITHSEIETDPTKIWPVVEAALKSALKDFQSMREKEGAAISRQIEEQIKEIEKRVESIADIAPKLIIYFKKRIEDRLKETGINVQDKDERIEKEIAILAEHIDIDEEITRMRSHISQFRSLMKKDEPVGRTMDFLIQEMMREINTMGSKAVHTDISIHIINVKSLLEKIREQIQNVE